MAALFLGSAFIISTCGLVYELVNGALASYLLGDSVTQFSTVIGVYLFAMGIGSYLTRYIRGEPIFTFVSAQILVGLVGGTSSALLFILFERIAFFHFTLYAVVTITGVLVGVEIPLLMRILKDQYKFEDLVSKVFTVDYVGALIASLLFPLLLVPHLGLIRTSLMFGVLNILVSLITMRVLARKSHAFQILKGTAWVALFALCYCFAIADRIESFAEAAIYPGQPIYTKTTQYQRIVITRQNTDTRLFLNQHLQFSSRDEYRYHEALVHPGLDSLTKPARVLVLGGGDGMAVREILKQPLVTSVTLVDLDREMTRIFKALPFLRELNGDAFNSDKVTVINADAFVWLRTHPELRFDLVVLDFPDPANYSIGKLYTVTFFKLLHQALEVGGRVVVQSTSPLAARKSYWCVAHTLQAAGFQITPYHVYVPSFGEWGFVIGTQQAYVAPSNFVNGTRFISTDVMNGMLHFPQDMNEVPTEVNRLNNQALVRYYESEWSEFMVN